MSDISHSDELVTKQELASFYQGILPYLGGMPEALSNKFNRSDIYSTDEKIIGCWTDGRPLYQKVLAGTMPNCTTDGTAVQSTISIGATVNTAFIECAFARTKSTESIKFSIPIQCAVGGAATVKNNSAAIQVCNCYIDFSNNTVVLNNGRVNYNGRTAYVVIRYTKTADAANSFNCSSESDYSTSEKVIGTWINGKPLYQKTVNFGTLPNATIKSVSHNISNVGIIVELIGYATNGTYWTPFPYANGSLANADNPSVMLRATSTKVEIQTVNNWSTYSAYITLKYTKTTD